MAKSKAKKKNTGVKKRTSKRKNKYSVSQVKEDAPQRRKFSRGGRVEAYTFGEALGSKRWP